MILRRILLVVCVGLLAGLCVGCDDDSTDSGPSALSTPTGWVSVWFHNSGEDPPPDPVDDTPADDPALQPNPLGLTRVHVRLKQIAFYNVAGERVAVKVSDDVPPVNLVDQTEVDPPRFFNSFPVPAGEYSGFEAVLELAKPPRDYGIVSQQTEVLVSGQIRIRDWQCTVPVDQQQQTIPHLTIEGGPVVVGEAGAELVLNIQLLAWDWCRTNQGDAAVASITIGDTFSIEPKATP